LIPNRPAPSRRRRAGLGAPRTPVPGNGTAHNGNVPAALSRRRRASAYRQVRRVPRRHRAIRVVLIVVAVLAAFGATAAGVAFAGYNIYKAQLPDATTIAGLEPALDSYVYDSTGALIYVYHGQGARHDHIALANVSRWVKLATVDIEDRHFYTEGSWDLPRLFEAGVTNLTHSGSTQGASTITEQLAKLSLEGGGLLAPTAARSLDYKIKEIVLGNEISIDFTKDQILEMYLNRIYYGNQATGIETAAELYFHKDASQLDLAESAMLAGLPQSPSYYDPVSNPQPAKQRQGAVLQAMVTNGDISQAQASAAYAEPLTYHSWTDSDPSLAPGYNAQGFVDFLTQWLVKNFGDAFIDPGGWHITTTLDPGKQTLAVNTVHAQVLAVRNSENLRDGALVSMDPRTGEVYAIVGSYDYNDPEIGQQNMALAGWNNVGVGISPGSSIKLFTYAAAIASGKYTMTTPILDAPYTFPVVGGPGYSPLDYDRKWHGMCQLKTCLGNSFNMPAVKVEYATGIPYITNVEIAAGISAFQDASRRPEPTQWSATLGGVYISLLDLADGASTIADLGVHHDPIPVTKIVDSMSGQSVFSYDAQQAGKRVMPDNVAFIMDEITSNDANRQSEFGANGPLTLPGRRVSAKTGTAEYFVDNLTIGWTPTLLTAVWVGNPNPNCLSPSDYSKMDRYIAQGHVVEPGETDHTYPFSPSDLAQYGIKPQAGIANSCGHLDGVVSGVSGAAPIWHQYMAKALAGQPATWYPRPSDVIASGPGDNADFFLPSTQQTQVTGPGCIYWQPHPDPSNPCQYVGTSPPAGGLPTPKPAPGPPQQPAAPAPKPTPPIQSGH
jgi:membrane peptidoglycan carboxypeptidase